MEARAELVEKLAGFPAERRAFEAEGLTISWVRRAFVACFSTGDMFPPIPCPFTRGLPRGGMRTALLELAALSKEAAVEGVARRPPAASAAACIKEPEHAGGIEGVDGTRAEVGGIVVGAGDVTRGATDATGGGVAGGGEGVVLGGEGTVVAEGGKGITGVGEGIDGAICFFNAGLGLLIGFETPFRKVARFNA